MATFDIDPSTCPECLAGFDVRCAPHPKFFLNAYVWHCPTCGIVMRHANGATVEARHVERYGESWLRRHEMIPALFEGGVSIEYV